MFVPLHRRRRPSGGASARPARVGAVLVVVLAALVAGLLGALFDSRKPADTGTGVVLAVVIVIVAVGCGVALARAIGRRGRL